jgi:hypothetical protein
MNWDALAAFISAEDPAFASLLRGVPHEELARVEEEFGLRLPLNYRQFVTTMGKDSAGLYLFGPSQNQTFDDLLIYLPDDSYPAERYFRIAFPVDDSDISPPDYFLDLSRSDGVDAPVVMFEDTGSFKTEDVEETGFTFGEQVTRRVFTVLVLDRLPERATLVLARPSPELMKATKGAVLTLLGTMGFVPVLPELERVSCLRRGRLGALVDERVNGLAVAISIGSDDAMSLEVVLDQLLERFPDGLVNRPGGPLGG